ncbi:hypothetical protein I5L79_07925 [Hymenobacter sp. BT594]|uniref:Uncharacterized protein n=1 Tax=Hymenobacter guriensis TaxID=2793065 RepID=A0ABS0L226_9BACT|nr:hypothetical protein [Hymenobacter guriensis]
MAVRRSASLRSSPILRRTGIVAGISLLLALLLISYLYGFSNEFFARLFGAFFVLFCLLAVTFLGVVPFVSWAATHWFGPGWEDSALNTTPPRKKASPAVSGKPLRQRVRSNP